MSFSQPWRDPVLLVAVKSMSQLLKLREMKYYAITLIATALLLFTAYDLGHCDLAVPLHYAVGDDSLYYMTLMRTLQETGWVHVNPRLGAPGALDFYDFPVLGFAEWLLNKALIGLSGDPIVAYNLYYFLGFFLSGCSALFVLRHFGISGSIAVSAALLFAFQPYHFWRGTWHAGLAFYWAIPLGVLLCLWLCEERPVFVRGATEQGEQPTRGRAIAAIAICVIMASFFVYYAWFMGFFLVVSGLIVWLRRPRLAPPWDVCICLAVFLGAVLAQVVPYAVHWKAHGRHHDLIKRSPGQAQYYGLAVSELVLPTIGHRIPQLRVLESRQTVASGLDPKDPRIGNRTKFINEKYWNALGAVGATGFLFLCTVLLAPEAGWLARLRPIVDLSRFNIAAVLLGSGFALLVSVLFPFIRAYNRIAIFIAFFSLFAVARIAEALHPREGSPVWSRAFFLFLIVAATSIGLLDQIPSVITPDHRAQSKTYAREADYALKLEALVNPGSMIFQLPYSQFPEGIHFYEHFRLYHHSTTLHFSYGATLDSKADLWQRAVADKPVPEMVAALEEAGFAGIHVDFGLLSDNTYAAREHLVHLDNPSELRADLDRVLGSPALVGNDGKWVFYRLSNSR
jgi:hypothetical protein